MITSVLLTNTFMCVIYDGYRCSLMFPQLFLKGVTCEQIFAASAVPSGKVRVGFLFRTSQLFVIVCLSQTETAQDSNKPITALRRP